jgi:hypothetical protein
MPFQISELVIRVATDSPDGAFIGQEAVSECRQGGHTCLPNVTDCRKGGSTCAPPNVPSDCRKGGATCAPPDRPSECRKGGATCPPPSKSERRDAELDFVLRQIRDTVAAEIAGHEVLVTA